MHVHIMRACNSLAWPRSSINLGFQHRQTYMDGLTGVLRSVQALYEVAPYMMDLRSFFQDEFQSPSTGVTAMIPVTALRYSQASFEKGARFMHGPSGETLSEEDRRSIYEFLDHLIRGIVTPEQIGLRVTLWDSKLYTKDNRRLAALMMLQGLKRDVSIRVKCRIDEPDSEFTRKFGTATEGLSIAPSRLGSSAKHLGADLFQPAAQAQKMHERLVRKHGEDHPGVEFLLHLKRRASSCRDNADTLTWESAAILQTHAGRDEMQSVRGRSRSRSRRRNSAEQQSLVATFGFPGRRFTGDRNDFENIEVNQAIGGAAVSVAFIARFDSFNLHSRIIDFGNGKENTILIANWQNSPKLYFSIATGSRSNGTWAFRRVMTNDILKLGKMQRFLCTATSSGEMKIFCEGREVARRMDGLPVPALIRQRHYIGKSYWEREEPFHGWIQGLSVSNSLQDWSAAFHNALFGPYSRF